MRAKPDGQPKTGGVVAAKLYERRNAEFALEPPWPTKQMSVELSNVCNHRCSFCPHGKMTRPKRFIDEGLLYRALREAYDLGTREVGLFILGEPFASKNLAEYIRRAKEMGYDYVYITTNGALANAASLRAVFEAGLDSIKFSINGGTRETYREIHGADDFDKVIENARWCAEYRETSKHFNLFCSYVVTARSLSEAKRFKEQYGSLFDEIAFYKVMNRGGMMAAETKGMMPDVGGENRTHMCAHPFNCIYVTCEGYLSPCALDAFLKLKVGDLNTSSLKDAWYGEDFKRLRQQFIDGIEHMPEQCQACCQSESILANILDI